MGWWLVDAGGNIIRYQVGVSSRGPPIVTAIHVTRRQRSLPKMWGRRTRERHSLRWFWLPGTIRGMHKEMHRVFEKRDGKKLRPAGISPPAGGMTTKLGLRLVGDADATMLATHRAASSCLLACKRLILLPLTGCATAVVTLLCISSSLLHLRLKNDRILQAVRTYQAYLV